VGGSGQGRWVVPRLPSKPKLRGTFHKYGFFVSLGVGATLVGAATGGRARVAAAVFAATATALLGVSALYHCGNWRGRLHGLLQRLDHSLIFLTIAATYTPFALLALKGLFASALLVAVWAGAAVGTAAKLLAPRLPRALYLVAYLVLGWLGVVTLGQLPATVGWLGVAGVVGGGLLYTGGAIVYATRKPDPAPQVFGYHELFHVLVLAALALHYAVIASLVVGRR